jgi:hypothetical protein
VRGRPHNARCRTSNFVVVPAKILMVFRASTGITMTAISRACCLAVAGAELDRVEIFASGVSHTPSGNPRIASIRSFISLAPFEEPTVQAADDCLSAAMILPTPKLFESRNGIRSFRCSGICDYTAPDSCCCSPGRFDYCFHKQAIAPWLKPKTNGRHQRIVATSLIWFKPGLCECREPDQLRWSLSVANRASRQISRIFLAIPAGLEPATRGVEIRYSIQLSYGTVGVTYRTISIACSISKIRFPGIRPNHFPGVGD